VNAAQIIRQLEALPASEQAQVQEWLNGRSIESDDVLRELDAAAHSADERGTTSVHEVRKMLPQWISKSA